ncbi:MAG: F0F1 ATP synthase subunit alpha, partial [Candidatus Eremiobacteraeota bacterium]|nr:F0F1 ATP synthase subunit alpha [Candidatus Eremiobacteraeota bacterium]
MKPPELRPWLQPTFDRLAELTARPHYRPPAEEVGRIRSLTGGIALVDGLPSVGLDELVELAEGALGMVMTLAPSRVGVVLLDPETSLQAGSRARRTGRVADLPVGPPLLGRVIDPLGRPLDGGAALPAQPRAAVEAPAPAIMERAPVNRPLQTGIKVVDALLPIGRGQRELIVGDRQTGKTSLALDAILHQKGSGVVCVYCSVGQRDSGVARVLAELRQSGAFDYSCLVVAASEDPPGLRFLAPYAATSVAE